MITNYTPENYNAASQNWSIIEDHRGIMYFGNQTGILEFDGVEWKRLTHAGNSSTPVRALNKDSRGRVYYGAYGDLGYLAIDSFGITKLHSLLGFVPTADRNFSDIWTIYTSDNMIYFQSRENIIQLQRNIQNGKENWTSKVLHPETRFMYAFLLDNVYYIHQQDKGLYRVINGQLMLIPGSEFLGTERVQVILPFDSDNTQKQYLVGMFYGGLYRFDGNDFRPFRTEADPLIKSGQVLYKGLLLKNGGYALSTAGNGLVIIDAKGKLIQHINKEMGLQDESVYGAYEDKNGILWIALDNGISKTVIHSPFSYFASPSGINSSPLSLNRFNGSLYLGTSNGLQHYDTTKMRFELVQGFPRNQVFSLFVDSETLYIPGNGLFTIQKNKPGFAYTAFRTNMALSALHFSKKHPDILLGAGNFGVAVFQKKKLNKSSSDEFKLIGYLPKIDYPTWTFATGKDDYIWVGTQNGIVYRISLSFDKYGVPDVYNSIVEQYDEKDGLRNALGSVYEVNFKAYFISDSCIYSYDDQKKIFVNDTTFGQFNHGGGNQDGYIAEDGSGRVWIKFGNEIRLAVPEKKQGYKIQKRILPSIERNTVNFIYPEKDGIVWFGTANSLIRYDEKTTKPEEQNYRTLIRQATAGKELLNINPSINTTSGNAIKFIQNNLRFDYAAPVFDNETQILYQTKLEGFQDAWSDLNRSTYKEYTNLPAGKYQFHVRAINIQGKLSEEDKLTFTIKPPWHQTLWAYLVYILGGILLTMLIVRYRTRHLLAREKQLIRIYKVAEKFVPFEFIKSLGHSKITEINLGDHVEKIVTVLFSDIRNYTTISEQMSPEENFIFVHDFQLIMGPIIRKYNGFVNQFLGDGIMAIFPGSADDALAAAVEMQKALKDSEIFGTKGTRSSLGMGIGLHTGPIIMGIIGDNERLEAATISDTANTASRIESLTKFYKCEILMSEASFHQVTGQVLFLRPLGPVKLKGKKEIFNIYECFSSNLSSQIELKNNTLPIFKEGTEHYVNKSFDQAAELFSKITRENPLDQTAQHFLEKSVTFKKTGVPEAWTGVEEMNEK